MMSGGSPASQHTDAQRERWREASKHYRQRDPSRRANRTPNTVCDLCAVPIYRAPSNLATQVGTYCSHACRNRAYPNTGPRGPLLSLRGSNNPAWKGGVTYSHSRGNYGSIKHVRAPDWALPMARKNGYVMEHRLVMAQLCRRLLTRTEVVHHVDHNPPNNVPLNLELWPDNRSHKLAEHGRFVVGAKNTYAPSPDRYFQC